MFCLLSNIDYYTTFLIDQNNIKLQLLRAGTLSDNHLIIVSCLDIIIARDFTKQGRLEPKSLGHLRAMGTRPAKICHLHPSIARDSYNVISPPCGPAQNSSFGSWWPLEGLSTRF